MLCFLFQATTEDLSSKYDRQNRIAYPRTTTDRTEEDQKLFRIYKSYFEDMWEKNVPPVIELNAMPKA